jgi:hypothetical protein
MNVDMNMFLKNPNMLLAKISSKKKNIAKTNMKDEKPAKQYVSQQALLSFVR